MNRKQLERELERAIKAGVVSSHDSVGALYCTVYVTAMFADGDHPVVQLSKRLCGWYLCDQGHTFVRQGAGTIEMSLRLGLDGADFVDDLRIFVGALLMVDAIRTKV